MSISVDAESVRRVLSNLLGRRAASILGAGASANVIPLGTIMNNLALAHVLSDTRCIMPGTQGRAGRGRNWIKPNGCEWSFANGAIGQLSREQLRLLECRATTPVGGSEPPLSYVVFSYVPVPLTLLSFNADGYGPRLCSNRHVVREMHGANDPRFPHGWEFRRLFEMADQGHDVVPRGYLACFEPERVDTFGVEWYAWWFEALSGCSDLIIVGYTFGHQPDGSLNDWLSFELVRAYLADKPVAITVIDLDPEPLVDRLKDQLRNGNIVGVVCNWEHLAGSIIDVSRNTIENNVSGAFRRCDDVVRDYVARTEGVTRMWRDRHSRSEQSV